jgi:hypothetical protein
MNEDPMADPTSGERPDDQELTPAPRGIFWPLKRLWWSLEKHLLWPVSDSFRRAIEAMRYRSPLAYIGATALVCLTAGAVATAVYFHNEANQTEPAPAVAESPLGNETVVAPVSPPPVAGNPSASDDESLQGVAPDFSPSAESSAKNGSGGKDNGGGSNGNSGGNSNGSSNDNNARKLPKTAVRPSDLPNSPPLRVAYRFANTFVGYEVGEKKASRRLGRNSTRKLFRELADKPPRLPSNTKVPKATVMNVVAGRRKGREMEASVALFRSGSTSELRVALSRKKGEPWLVSEVRG